MNELNFKLTVDQTNKILEGLGKLPYGDVYELIQTIQVQAQEQLNGDSEEVEKTTSKKK